MKRLWTRLSRGQRWLVGVFCLTMLIPLLAYGYVAIETSDAPPTARLTDASSTQGTQIPSPTDPNGAWTAAPVSSDFVGYRIRERIAGISAPGDVVGRTRHVSGKISVKDDALVAGEITVDMTTVSTGVAPRDDTMRTQGLQTDAFPEATFKLSEPVPLGTVAVGRIVHIRMVGDLTLHGQTHNVSFDADARWNGPTIQVAGNSQIKRSDFGIDVSDLAGFRIQDEGTIEFQLTFSFNQDAAPPAPLGEDKGTTGDPYAQLRSRPCTSRAKRVADQRRLLFAAEHAGMPALFLVRADGTELSRLHTALPAIDAAWTPNGSRVLYTSSPPTDSPPTVRELDLATGHDRSLGLNSVSSQGAAPSPDGTHVAYVVNDGQSSRVWVASIRGNDAHPVSSADVFADAPAWRTNTTLSFTANAGNRNDDIYIADIDRDHSRRITGYSGYEYTPAWSPDGRTVAFGRDGDIWMRDMTTGVSRHLTHGGHDSAPSWSPDGRSLAFMQKDSLFLLPDLTTVQRVTPVCVATGLHVSSGAKWRP